VHCLESYEARRGLESVTRAGGIGAALAGSLRTASLVPVISDFLFDDAPAFVRELVHVNVIHDVFLVLVDSAFAFADADLAAGWITIRDVEGGGSRVVSRRVYRELAARARQWQADVAATARAAGLDVVSLGAHQGEGEVALAEFVAERRLRKVAR
jgi:hypothetical protein